MDTFYIIVNSSNLLAYSYSTYMNEPIFTKRICDAMCFDTYEDAENYIIKINKDDYYEIKKVYMNF